MKERLALVSAPRLGAVLAATMVLLAGASPPRDFISDHLAGPPMLMHGTGAAHTLKIVFLGDGFTSKKDSIDRYRAAVKEMVEELIATEPFLSMSSALSIYRMDVISDEPVGDEPGGIDVPERCPDDSTKPDHQYDLPPPPAGAKPAAVSRRAKNPNNVLETSWCGPDVLGRGAVKFVLSSGSARVAEFARASLIVPDITIVLANDFMFGAAAVEDGDVVYVSIGKNLVRETNPDTGDLKEDLKPGVMAHVLVHEIGHVAPFNLLDEYPVGRDPGELPDLKGLIDASPNLATTQVPPNWEGVVPTGVLVTSCPSTSAPEVGAVPGGYGFVQGVFRSRCSCRMNESTTPGTFCAVCRERIRSKLASNLPPSLARSGVVPSGAAVGRPR